MENLNAEQIKHVLECCKGDDLSLCRQCEYHIPGDPVCIVKMAADALALINSQEQKIKELTEENKKLTINMNAYGLTAKRLGEENERLREDNDQWTEMWADNQRRWENAYSKLQAENEMLLNIKNLNIDKVISDTVRKMHSEIKDRCIKGGIYPAFVARTIDTVTKEILEGKI